MPLPFFIIMLVFQVLPTSSEKILIFHHVSSYSHRVQSEPLAHALMERGHDVHYITAYHPKEPNANISELVPTKLEAFVDMFLNREFDVNLRIEKTMNSLIHIGMAFGHGACEAILTSQNFKDWLKVHTKFDLVFVDNCLPECGATLAYKLGAKFVLFHSLPPVAMEYDTFGFLPESSAVPALEHWQPEMPFSFWNRIQNTLWSLRWRWAYYQHLEQMDSLLRKGLDMPDMPYVDNLLRNVSMIFCTGDITDYPRSDSPMHVNVAGMHIKESNNTLSPELDTFIRRKGTGGIENDGFVLISFGSVVVSPNFPEKLQKIFFETIKAFSNVRFLWKWNGPPPKHIDIPENLHLAEWYPQMDLLSHPKVKGLITQGGRPSTSEAVFNAVPMIGFPVFSDQDHNVHRMSQLRGLIKLEFGTVTLEILKEAVGRIVYDLSFKERMLELQKIYRDRPMSPIETGVFWTEYILRHEDTSHLKPAGFDQNWFVRRSLDVYGFIIVLLYSFILLLFMAMTHVVKRILKGKNKKLKQKKK